MLSHRWSKHLSLAVLGLACTHAAVTVQAQSSSNLSSRSFAARATVLGKYVYIDGGVTLTEEMMGKEEEPSPSFWMFSIDISKSWSTDQDPRERKFYPDDAQPILARASHTLWTDDDEGAFYSWGGEYPSDMEGIKNELWKFTADARGGGTWILAS
ncbi:hypothetical protein C8A01DRAFT_35356 [Parachaetomium inaequale]|uniref:Uncharacterized protein n=1 Tax=Parachaetomium inaequale TaxID=2588326 RepID=A0AAN6SRM9_9PEZI|nr:hypothetical protein C8A01DRAFT_35356 [Parachaetomium inaequale]